MVSDGIGAAMLITSTMTVMGRTDEKASVIFSFSILFICRLWIFIHSIEDSPQKGKRF